MTSGQPQDHPDSVAIPTSRAHHGIDSALTFLTVVLADPRSGIVDDDLADDVADVVSGLVDVHPPMPPLVYPDQGADDDHHALALIAHARRRLQLAVVGGADEAERLRAAVACHRLRTLLVRREP